MFELVSVITDRRVSMADECWTVSHRQLTSDLLLLVEVKNTTAAQRLAIMLVWAHDQQDRPIAGFDF